MEFECSSRSLAKSGENALCYRFRLRWTSGWQLFGCHPWEPAWATSSSRDLGRCIPSNYFMSNLCFWLLLFVTNSLKELSLSFACPSFQLPAMDRQGRSLVLEDCWSVDLNGVWRRRWLSRLHSTDRGGLSRLRASSSCRNITTMEITLLQMLPIRREVREHPPKLIRGVKEQRRP